MAENSYRVVCDSWVHSRRSAARRSLADEPKLVILGAQSADNALIEAVSARKLWPDSKIILLYEYAFPCRFSEAANVGDQWLRSVVCVSRDANQHARPDRHQGSPRHGRGRRERPVIQPAQPDEPNQSDQIESSSRTAPNMKMYQLASAPCRSVGDRSARASKSPGLIGARGPDPRWSRERACQ